MFLIINELPCLYNDQVKQLSLVCITSMHFVPGIAKPNHYIPSCQTLGLIFDNPF